MMVMLQKRMRLLYISRETHEDGSKEKINKYYTVYRTNHCDDIMPLL